MQILTRPMILALGLLMICAWATAAEAAPPADKQVEFFEQHVRPLLIRRCYECHSTGGKQKGGLLLDSRKNWQRGGESGPAIVPGQPEQSLLIQAVKYENFQMPPSGKLPAEELAILQKWIKLGAPDPRDEEPAPRHEYGVSIEEGRRHWAYQLPALPTAPEVNDASWPYNNVDRFIRAQQEKAHLEPVADAEPLTLVRRASFALTGLPPTPELVETFLRDESPQAYARLIDRLLASPQFGERWAQHWFDIARFAESLAAANDLLLVDAWRFRDYVIRSLNNDKPYDQFLREQLAGDLLPWAVAEQRDEQIVATGFLAMGQHDFDRPDAQVRWDQIDEQIDVVTRAMLGMTVACARCHDHKFDPIPTRDYYALAGIFASTEIHKMVVYTRGKHTLVRVDQGIPLAGYRQEPVDRFIALQEELYAGRNPVVRMGWQLGLLRKSTASAADPLEKARLAAEAETLAAKMAGLEERSKAANQQLHGFPQLPPMALGVSDAERIGDACVLVRGEVENRGPVVPRGFLQVLQQGDPPKLSPSQSGRKELAEWIASRSNPLTARVLVNRVWHHLFGVGLVPSVDNLGMSGELPSHPELLDYLAVRFMDEGWSVKSLIREIMLSRTYRLAVARDAENEEVDADNRLLWRQNRRRLEAEALRDTILAFKGTLDLEPRERSLIAEIGVGSMRFQGEQVHFDSRKRSIYLPRPRRKQPEILALFDGADNSVVTGDRDETTVPSQALFLLNSPFVRQQAEAAATRLLKEARPDEERIARAFQLAFSRPASQQETEAAVELLAFSTRESGQKDDPAQPLRPTGSAYSFDAWTALCQTLIASSEFRYVH